MTTDTLEKLRDGLKTDALKFKNRGETAYANGLFDAAQRISRHLPDSTVAVAVPVPVVVEQPLPPELDLPEGV